MSAQSVTHANTHLPGQQAHTGRMPVRIRSPHKDTHTLIPPIHTQSLHSYTPIQCLRAGHEHTPVVFISTFGIFAGRMKLHAHEHSHNLYKHIQSISDIQ